MKRDLNIKNVGKEGHQRRQDRTQKSHRAMQREE